MELRGTRFVSLIMLGMFVFLLCVNPTSAVRTNTGSSTLSTGEYIENTLIGYSNGRIEGSVNATEGPLEIYVIHSDDYVNVSSINIIDCIVYEYDLLLEFRFDVTREGEWVLILRNPNAFNVTFGLTWSSYDADESPILSNISTTIFSLFFVVIVVGYIITVKRSVHSDVGTGETNPFLPAIVGFVFIGLSLLLPSLLHLNSTNASGSSENVLGSLLWELTITVDGFSFQLVNSINPYAWMFPLLFFGPAFLYPYALMSYYQGRITKRRSIKIGFIGILPILALAVLAFSGPLIFHATGLFILIPLPLVFILGLLVTKLIPAPKMSSEFPEF